MSVYEFVCLRRILTCSVLLTVLGITFLCSMDTQTWFKQANLPTFRQERLQNHGNMYETDERQTLPKHALGQIDAYMKFTDFKDFLSLVNISTSVVTIRNNKSDVAIGDDVIVDIVLYNGRGSRSTRGGDMLRVWLRETSRNASVSGYVIDHDNGSYTGVVKAMWTGNPELMFSIANTKEHIGIFMNIVQKHGLIKFLRAGFIKRNLTESTLCSVKPNIPSVTDYCNFTTQNFNFSFFCGKPKHKDMDCKDWVDYAASPNYSCNVKNKALFMNYKYFSKKVGMLKVVAGSGTTGESGIFCCDVRSKTTWQTTNPTGYFYNGTWRSLICKPSTSWTYESYAKCLKNRPVLMTGDSTTRNWYSPLAALLKLRILVGRHEIKDKAWQKFAEAENKNKTLSMYWAPHEIPFYSYEQNKNNFKSVASRIDALPGNKSAIIILHWYGHLTGTIPQQYREHVASAKHAIVRLLRRSPHSSILIKGPHSFTYSYFFEPFDYISRIYRQILYEEFKDLQDKVYFIDQWDATVGNENLDIHPKASLNPIMANFVFSFVCK